jgi:predicted phosphatase
MSKSAIKKEELAKVDSQESLDDQDSNTEFITTLGEVNIKLPPINFELTFINFEPLTLDVLPVLNIFSILESMNLQEEARKAKMLEEFLNPINREKSDQATAALNNMVKLALDRVLLDNLMSIICDYNYVQVDKVTKFVSREIMDNLYLNIKMGHIPDGVEIINVYHTSECLYNTLNIPYSIKTIFDDIQLFEYPKNLESSLVEGFELQSSILGLTLNEE